MTDFALRAVTVADIPAIGALVRASEAHDRIPRVFPDDELEQDFASPDNEMRVAVRADNIVGWASIWHPPAPERLDRAQLFGEVAPEHRGTGIGRALMEWSVTRAQQRFAARDHDLPCYMRINVYDWLDDRQRLYRRFGFEAVRWNDELIRPLHDIPPIPTVEGVTLRPWPDDRDEELRAVRNAAFADHWGSIVLAPDVWHDHAYGYGARPDLSVIAIDDATGSVIASCANASYPEDEAVTGRKDAWIANVATRREWRGRGIASALMLWSLDAFARAGFTHALLGVDTDNPTGAARLYRNLGFEPNHREIVFQREVPRTDDASLSRNPYG
jgi:mycothiol synthase